MARGSTTPTDPAPSALPAALIRYFDARTAAFLAARKTLGVGELDARALLYVAEHPGTRPRDLGEFLGITSAGVTTLTDRLAKRDAVRRDFDDTDRRVVRLTATVDLTREPWSALKRFDDALRVAADSLVPADSEAARVAVDSLTETAARKSL